MFAGYIPTELRHNAGQEALLTGVHDLTDLVRRDRPGPSGLSRRKLFVASASLATLALPRFAQASDEDVRQAIWDDFGVSELPEGEVLIDMPDYSDSGKSVPLTVTVPASMEGLDYPEVVAVYAARNPRPRIAQVYFTTACAEATFSTRVRVASFQDITVVVKMASGEIFKGVRSVDVTYGACEEAVANDQFPPGWAPRIRLAVPDTANQGENIEIRTIIGHPMETGFRYNSSGLTIPVRITEWFRCFANGDQVFGAKLEPAISANPYFAFHLRIEETTLLRFEWVDTTGDLYVDEARVLVT